MQAAWVPSLVRELDRPPHATTKSLHGTNKRFHVPWQRPKIPRATTKTWNSQKNKYLFIFKKDLVPPRQRTPVPFLVGKLRSHMPSGSPPQKKKMQIAIEQNRQTRTHPKRGSHVDINTLQTPAVPWQSAPDPATPSPDTEVEDAHRGSGNGGGHRRGHGTRGLQRETSSLRIFPGSYVVPRGRAFRAFSSRPLHGH